MFPARNSLWVYCAVLAMASILGLSGLVLAQHPPTVAQAVKRPSDPPNLKEDPVLQVEITEDFQPPKIQDIVARLRAETKMDLTLADNINPEQPAFSSLSCHNVPAWKIMNTLAKSEVIQGEWKRTDTGYRLTSPLPPPVLEKAIVPIQPSPVTPKPWRRYYLAGFLSSLVLALLLLFFRQRQARQTNPADQLR